MKIYVGRWDLLPESWEGINGLSEKMENEIQHEVSEQKRVCAFRPFDKDFIPGVYSAPQFECLFNQDLDNKFNTKDYWIKIF